MPLLEYRLIHVNIGYCIKCALVNVTTSIRIA